MIATISSGCTDPYYHFNYGYSDTTITGTNQCQCPNCGCTHNYAPPNSRTYYFPPQEPEPAEDIKEALKQWHKALSRQAAWEASVALRGEGKERRGPVSLQAQKAPYVRPTSKKRVCGGSSRYRVRVN
jgi:hypothetical protein